MSTSPSERFGTDKTPFAEKEWSLGKVADRFNVHTSNVAPPWSIVDLVISIGPSPQEFTYDAATISRRREILHMNEGSPSVSSKPTD